MATILSAREICNRALRLIGAFSINDSAADGEHVQEALFWLDMQQAELAGKVQCFWLMTETLSFDLTPGTDSYDLKDALADDWPDEGIEYVADAWLENAEGTRSKLTIKRRQDFEEICRSGITGQPRWLYIDRVAEPTVRTYPVLADTTDTWSVKLVIQKQAPSVSNVGPIPKEGTGESLGTGLPAAWNLYQVYKLASHIGNGPVRKLPLQTVLDYRGIAKTSYEDMEAFQNTEKETSPPITRMPDDC